MSGGLGGKIGASMLKPVFKNVQKAMDYSQYGGAVLLGLKAPVVKTHGSSKAPTVKNTIGQIRELITTKSADQLVTYFADHTDEMAALKESLK